MKVGNQHGLLLIIFFSLMNFACAGRDFGGGTGHDRLTHDTVNPEAGLGQNSDDANAEVSQDASEPVMIGGGFLACFVDQSLLPTDAESSPAHLPVGCSIYAASDFVQRLDAVNIEISEAQLLLANQQRLNIAMTKQVDHPRWSWITQVPARREPYDVILTISDSTMSGALPKLTLRIGEALPPGLLGPGFPADTEFKFRLLGSDLCLSGDPIWSFSDGAADAEELTLSPCNSAISFRLSPWLDGYRVHTHNPSPFSCNANDYDQDFCGRSCIDLEDFGRGDTLSLFGCTRSLEAQLASFIVIQDRSVQFSFNNRYLVHRDLEVGASASATPASQFELISDRRVANP